MEILMVTNKKTIVFTVVFFGEGKIIKTHTGEYRNLMVLLNEKFYIENFGDCGGMGRCATCIVEIKNDPHLVSRQRNEESTLIKMGISQSNIRLACQILVNEELENAVIKIGAE
jgi:2Fe-2S ferredoxin